MTLLDHIFNETARYRTLDFAYPEADETFVERVARLALVFVKQWIDSLTWQQRDKTGLCIQKLLGILRTKHDRIVDLNHGQITINFTLFDKRVFEVILFPTQIVLRDFAHATLHMDEHTFLLEGFVGELADVVSSSDEESLTDTSSE